MSSEKKGGFTSSLGFILAAAGSAVGVGNIWRFPYLAAQDGGGLFLLVYLILVLTFWLYAVDYGYFHRTAYKDKCVECFWRDASEMGFFRETDFFSSGLYYDLLYSHWRLGD